MTTPEQNQHIAEWVAALRSGKYAQSRGALKTEDGFCCLGVACEVMGLKAKRHHGSHFLYDGTETRLPQKAMDYFGLSHANGRYKLDGFHLSLANMNDNGATFSQISDIIESRPEGLFV